MAMDARLLELEQELANRQQALNSESSSQIESPGIDARLAELESELLKRQSGGSNVPHVEIPEEEPGFDWSRYIGEQMAKGALSLGDVLAEFGKDLPEGFRASHIMNREPLVETPSELIEETVQPETGIQRIVGHAARAIPGALIGGPTGLLRNAAIAGSTGAASGTLQEAGVPPLMADIASIVGIPAGTMAINKIKGIGKDLTGKEKKIAEYLQKNIGEENIPNVSHRLKNPPKHAISGYQPMTAEVAESPALSQLHRLQYEIPGSGLPQHAGRQNDALMGAIEEATLNAPIGKNLEKPLTKKLTELKEVRHKETAPLYEEIEKMTEPLNPKNVKKFLKETVAKGDVEKDLNYVKKLIGPSHKLTPEEMAYKKYYDTIKNPDILSQLDKPKSPYPSVNELVKAKEAIGARIEKRTKSGESQRALMLKRAKTALEEDLEKIPLQAEAAKKYKELSEPISNIRKHPTLKTIADERKLKRKLTNHMGKLFDEASADNVSALKNVLSEDKHTWENIREASIDHFIKSISNAGAEGKGHVMSYPKMKNFMEKHHEALDELLTTDQTKLLHEVENVVRGQHRAKTLGRGEGSPTHARLRTDLGLAASTGMKAAELAASTQPGITKKVLGVFLMNWGKNHQEQMMNVLNRSLLEPEYAHKLINFKPKTQTEFNKFINSSLRRAPILITNHEKED